MESILNNITDCVMSVSCGINPRESRIIELNCNSDFYEEFMDEIEDSTNWASININLDNGKRSIFVNGIYIEIKIKDVNIPIITIRINS